MKTRLLFLILVPKHSCFFLFPQLNLKTELRKAVSSQNTFKKQSPVAALEGREEGGTRERRRSSSPYLEAAELPLAGEASTAPSKLGSGQGIAHG